MVINGIIMKKTVLLLGSTGLIGSIVLDRLLNDSVYSKVIILVRKPQGIQHSKIVEIITDFKSPIDLSSFNKIDSIFSCLGTTRKKTPDLQLYKKIEVDIPLAIAKQCLSKGLEKFHYISAIGANENSSNFYLKMKGEAEVVLTQLPIPILNIYQPSLLIGNRKEKRLAEDVGAKIYPFINIFLIGALAKYKAIKASELAKGIVNVDEQMNIKGVQVFTYNDILKNTKKL